jgi:hypothetical protein
VKQYPDHERSVEVRGRKFTVSVWAATTCGPTVRAHATVDIQPGEDLGDLERAVLPSAVRNLGYEYQDVVTLCRARGQHQGHR